MPASTRATILPVVTLTDEEMIDLLRRIHAALNRSDFEAVIALAHPDIVIARAGGMGEVRGTAAIRDWMEPDAFESQVLEPLEYRVAGNRVLVQVIGHMRGAGSGIELDIRAWTLWTFGPDGRVTRVEVFLDHEEAEAQRAFAQ